MPLTIKNRVLGVLNVSNRRTSKSFSPVDIEILKVIARESAISLQNLKLINEQRASYLNMVIALARAIDARDAYTYKHSDNVAKYTVRISNEIGLSLQDIEEIKRAALLHDIGKIGMSDLLLSKTERLTEDEYAKIKMHPEKGEEIIKCLPFLQNISKIIRHHHERYDGSGYPDGISGENIELGARVLAVADSFDAMISDRPYRKALGLKVAKEELFANRYTQFDPHITDIFLLVLAKDEDSIAK